MIYKERKIRDWIFWVDWIMVAFIIYLLVESIPTLKFDGWGYDSFYLHKTVLIGLGFMVARLYINQLRMWKIWMEEVK